MSGDGEARGLRLTLVRHAKSSWRFGDLDDFRRPLNKRGMRDCLRMPALVAARLPRPDILLSSDAVRAVQTAQALADAYEVFEDRILLHGDLYLAGYRSLLKRICGVRSDMGHVMLVGHNPGISELCNYLLPTPVPELPTMAVAALRVDLRSWSELGRGRARLERVMLPKEMLKEGSK